MSESPHLQSIVLAASALISGENLTFDGSDPICPQVLFLSPLIFEGTGYRYIQIFLASIFCCFKMLQISFAKVKMPLISSSPTSVG